MKLLPLIFSSIRSNKIEGLFTFLAVTAAFALFGLMVAFNSTYRQVIESARPDRLFVTPRFGGIELTLSIGEQLQQLDGVTGVGAFYVLGGYHEDPRNFASIFTVSEGMQIAWSELPVRNDQWELMQQNLGGVLFSRKAADRWGVKEGDTFQLITPPGTRADGETFWSFSVLGIVGDDSEFPTGFILGNYNYYNNARPAIDQGRVSGFRVAVESPDLADGLSQTIDQLFINSTTQTQTISARLNTLSLANSGINILVLTTSVAVTGLLMILFLVGNSIAQSVRERITEFATLKTIGFTNGLIAKLIVAEAALPCMAGAIIGSLSTFLLAGQLPKFMPRGLFNLQEPIVSPMVFAIALISSLLLSLICSLPPIRQLNRADLATVLNRG